MPTLLRIGKTRFFFYSNEGNEPPHTHVEQAGATAKFWLLPVPLANFRGFDFPALRKLQRQVQRNQHRFLGAWHDHFSK